MIILRKLEWGNLFSYGDNNSIDFTKAPITQLVGLNGHGKSSIPLILEEALFCKNSKGTKRGDVLNRVSGAKKYWTKIYFSVDGIDYEVHVTRTSTNSVKLLKAGEDISSHTATSTLANIERIVGMDFKMFSSIIYQNARSSLSFLVETDTARKRFLVELLSLDRYTEIFEKVKVSAKTANDALQRARSKVDTITQWLKDHPADGSKNQIELVEVPERDNSLMEQRASIQAELSEIETINRKIETNNTNAKILDSIDSSAISSPPPKGNDTSKLHSDIGTEKAIIGNAKTHISKLSVLDGVQCCPTCEQSIDTAKVESLLSQFQSEIESSQTRIKELEASINKEAEVSKKYKEYEALVAKFEKYHDIVDRTMATVLLDKTELQGKISSLTVQIQEREASIKSAEAHNKAALLHNARLESEAKQLLEFSESLAKAQNDLDEVEEKASILEVLKKAFSTNGLLAYKIESSIKDLEILTNEYLTDLSDGRFQIEFAISNDKLNVVIYDNTTPIDITSLSSGELSRVNTATLLAIRKLMATISKSRINILFLDETIDTLDPFGRECLVEVLMKEEDLNTFVISHGYTHPMIEKISVIKEAGISRIES